MSKITDLTELTSGNIHDDDLVEIVDVSDTSMAATGTNKKAKLSTLRDAGMGNWKLLSTTTISGSPSTLEFPFSGSYRRYRLELENVYGELDGYKLCVRTSTDGGSTFDSGSNDYGYANGPLGSYGPILTTGTSIVTTGWFTGSATDEGTWGEIDFYDPLNASFKTFCKWELFGRLWSSDAPNIFVGTGYRDSAADVDTVQLFMSLGNFGGGKVRLFGWSE